MELNHAARRNLIIVIIIFVVIIALLATTAIILASRPKASSNTTSLSSSRQSSQPSSPEPDSASTLESPTKVTTKDGKQYFYYGAPAAQNNASPKKIIISLPGHDSEAEKDYAAWLPHIKDGTYALASLNWWDGAGETPNDYYKPAEVVDMTHYFLTGQGYTDKDIVILEGFSRGSANTYPVAANDILSPNPVFDGVISASGAYQSDFPLNPAQLNDANATSLFTGIYWILACGGKDPTPDRDGCQAMEETKTFLTAHGATVLSVLEDSNGGHGAFHGGTLKLPEQALQLLDGVFL